MDNNKNEVCGIIPVNKPEGFTSFDVIAKMRGILRIKRLGHAGTLDPMATGVLPVFVGKATKACDVIPEDEKSYTAGFRLGITTDTLDITGQVLSESDVRVTKSQIEQIIPKFLGDIMQIPPMYSAVKIDGKKLYELAREGKTIERKARPVRINQFELISFDEDTQSGEVFISCSKGTYIRTCIFDIGEALGCGGVMTSLVRNSSSGFKLEQCFTLDEIQQARDEGRIEQLISPVQNVFSCHEKICLDEYCSKLYRNGVKLRAEQCGIDLEGKSDGEVFSVFDFEDNFLGLASLDKQACIVRILKNFF